MKLSVTILFYFISLWSLAQGTWTPKADFAGTARSEAAGFSIGNYGYIVTGNDGQSKSDMWVWDQAADTWAGGTALPYAPGLKDASGVSHNGKGYLFFGYFMNEVWEYDTATTQWTQKNNFPGLSRRFSTAISNGDKIYIIAGDAGGAPYLSDCWEYDPDADTWVQKAAYPGGQTSGGTGFAIGNLIYFGTGNDNSASYASSEFYEYDPASNTWTVKQSLPGTSSKRRTAASFVLGNKGYIGLGWHNTSTYNYDFWEYDNIADTWTQRANFPGLGAYTPVGFAINDKGYFGTGGTSSGSTKQFWEYSPDSVSALKDLKQMVNISLFPNPCNGTFTLRSDRVLHQAKIRLINTLGQQVREQYLFDDVQKIDVSSVANGVYQCLVLENNHVVWCVQVMIN